MVTAAIIVAAVLAVHLPAAAGMTMADKYNHSSIYYDVKVNSCSLSKIFGTCISYLISFSRKFKVNFYQNHFDKS